MTRKKLTPPPVSKIVLPPAEGFSGIGAVVQDVGSATVVTLSVKVDGGLSTTVPKKVVTGPKIAADRIAAGIMRTDSWKWFPVRIDYMPSGEVQVAAGADVPAGASDTYIWGQVVLPK